MLIAGTNFSLMWHATQDRELRTLLQNAEFRFYLILVGIFTMIIRSTEVNVQLRYRLVKTTSGRFASGDNENVPFFDHELCTDVGF